MADKRVWIDGTADAPLRPISRIPLVLGSALAVLLAFVAFATEAPVVVDPSIVAEPNLSSPFTVLDSSDELNIIIIPTPFNSTSMQARLTTINRGTATTRLLDQEISQGIGRSLLGPGDQRLRLIDGNAVFISLGSVIVQPLAGPGPGTDVGDGVYVMPSSEPGHLWVVGSGSRWIRDLNVRLGRLGPPIQLESVGRPIGSVAEGLVMSISGSTETSLGIWTTEHGTVEMPIAGSRHYLGAAGNTILLSEDNRLVSFDIPTRTFTPLQHPIASDGLPRTFTLSPSGKRVAISNAGSVTQLPTVDILDLASGVLAMTIDPALAWQLQWVSEDDVLFLDPSNGSYALSIANVTTQRVTETVELDGSSLWFAGSLASG